MADEGTPLPRDFSRVVLTLDNVLLDEEKLRVSPSMIDGIKKEDETDLRILGCELIQTAGILMKMKQTAMATGQVVFHRFYYSKSFVKHNYEILAMASINLASKEEECPRRIRDVLNVFHHIKQVRGKRPIKPLVLDSQYILMKNQVIKAERRLLKELGFCVHVKHPHKIIVAYLQILELVDNRNVIQYAWNLMNDCLRTDVFVRYTPEAIACACIYLATRKCKIALPVKPPWYALFGVDLESIEVICKMILHLYSRPKPDQERLEKLCEEHRLQQLEEKKRKAKVGMHSLDGTPNSASRTNSPKVGASPSATLGKKIKTEDDSHLLENGSSEEKNGQKGKRRLDDSEGSHSAGSGSHTRSRSSRSHSRSLSPPAKKKKRSYSPVHRHKKDRYDDYEDYYYKEKRSHKRKKRARSRSLSQSPIPRYTTSKVSKKYSKEKHRSYSPQEKVHRSRKHRNGQRDLSPRYDKYRR